MKKKLLFVLPEFKYGGTVFSTLNMISLLRDKYDITVLAMTHQGPVLDKYRSVSIKILPQLFLLDTIAGSLSYTEKGIYRIKFFIFKVIKKAIELLGINYPDMIYKITSKNYSNKYDVVISCQEGIATHFISYIHAPKHIAWFRSECRHWLPELNKDIVKAINQESPYYMNCDKIICVSQTTCEDMKAYFPMLASKIIAIHNLQNIDVIINDSHKEIDDSRFIVDNFKIVSIGRMSPHKRFSYIPKIAHQLKLMGCDFTWFVIGGGNAFNEYDKFIANINKYNVRDVVIYLGEKLNPYPYIANCNLLVNISYVEACPRVVNEAKILQTPIVCTDFSSAKEFITSGNNGFITSIDNIHNPISDMVLNRLLYNKIKAECEKFRFSNTEIIDKVINSIEE